MTARDAVATEGEPNYVTEQLTDSQLVLLPAASQRADGAIDLTGNPKGSLAKKAMGKLLNDGLVEEVPAGSVLPAWRRDDDQGSLALWITARGLAAIGIDKAGASPEGAITSGRTAEEGDPTPDTSSHRTTALHKTAQNRRAAPCRKGAETSLPARALRSNPACS